MSDQAAQTIASEGTTLHSFLFRSEPLPDSTWSVRHRFIRMLAAVHIPFLTIFGLARGLPVAHIGVEMAGLGSLIVLASIKRFDRRTKEGLGTLALMLTSALLVHLSGGSIEAHFHFFVMLAVVSLYQSWFAFVLGIAFVLVHHGLLGTMHPSGVYNNPAAVQSPWVWAGIHAFFVTFASVIYVIQWRLNEAARNDARSLYRRLYEGERSVVRQMEEAATIKEELVSTVSHELRTPLTSIMGYIEILRDYEDLSDDDRHQFMEQASRQAGRLNFLIDNLMNYQGVGQTEDGPTNVGAVVNEVVEHQSGYPGAEGLRFDINVGDGVVAAVSERALRLIASNLVNNAVKYATPKTVVKIDAKQVIANGITVAQITVTNRGNPIKAEDRDRIFGAFVQLDSSVTRRVPGVGLGLHIVGRTVAAYRGTVDVVSEDGDITFTVRLPSVSPQQEHAA
jgi:signal transduction histidine kinase